MIENSEFLKDLFKFFFFSFRKSRCKVCILKEMNVLFQTNRDVGVIMKILGEVSALFSLFYIGIFHDNFIIATSIN